LAYQEQDDRDLLSRYGDLCVRLMERWQKARNIAPHESRAAGTIQLGIVSADIRDQSVWHALIAGWLEFLDRSKFSIHVFYTGSVQDEATGIARARAARFVHAVGGLDALVDAI